MIFFSGCSRILSEVNSGGGVWIFFLLLVGGGAEISGVYPLPGIF